MDEALDGVLETLAAITDADPFVPRQKMHAIQGPGTCEYKSAIASLAFVLQDELAFQKAKKLQRDAAGSSLQADWPHTGQLSEIKKEKQQRAVVKVKEAFLERPVGRRSQT